MIVEVGPTLSERRPRTRRASRYWRMGETAGSDVRRQQGHQPGTRRRRRLRRRGRARRRRQHGSALRRHQRLRDGATQPVRRPRTVTVEFWLKWNAYANDDGLAMEFTPNFNDQHGGFLVDPNAQHGEFGVAIGDGARATTSSSRGRRRRWHHYAFVLDTSAPGAPPRSRRTSTASRSLHQDSTRHRRRALRQLDPLLHVARGRRPVRRRRPRRGGDLRPRRLSAATIAAHYAEGTP